MAEIELRDVTKRYPDGTVAVKQMSLDIEDGEFMILVGPSGCGKSTALRMIAGLEDITEGELLIGDEVVNELTPKERDVAMVFQNYALYPHMSVRENMGFALKLAGVDKAEIGRRVEHAAHTLDLTEHLDRKPAQLSGGQRQRVAMGRAIVRDPAAFLMDEPLSNLDAKLRVQMRTEVSRLQDRLGTTTVYVTHDQTEAMTLGDRVAVMRAGVLQQVGAPQELYSSPDNLFVAGFIGSPPMNFLPARATRSGVDTPLGHLELDDRRSSAIQGHDVLLAGVRPEYFEDASFVDEAKRQHGTTFRARVDVTEWLGDSQFAYIPFEASADVAHQLRDLAVELDSDQLRTQAIVSIDAASHLREGRETEFWVDTRKVHIFDPKTGENLTRDAEAGARLTQEVAEERHEEMAAPRQQAPSGSSQMGPDRSASERQT
jgi:multiple sugar transport system ATP-binding protein